MRPSEALALHRDEVRSIMATYAIENPRIFGSTARGQDSEGSDLDVLVRRNGTLTFMDLARLEHDLSSLLGVKVDVRTEGEFSARVLGRIQQEFVRL